MLAPRQTLWSTPAEVVTATIRAIPLRATGDVVVDVGCGEGAVLLQWARELLAIMPRTTTTTTTTTANEESVTSTSNIVQDVTFIGIDVEERRIEAARAAWESLRAELEVLQQQLQQQQQQQPGRTTINTATTVVTTTTPSPLPPPGLVLVVPNITMTFICGNALECRPLWQPRATVLFVYLIPRGLRLLLPRPLVWPPLFYDHDDNDDDAGDDNADNDDNADESTTTTSATSPSSHSPANRIRAIASFMNPIPSLDDLALPTTTRATATGPRPRPRRRRRRQTVSRARLRIRVSDETMWPLYIYTVVDAAAATTDAAADGGAAGAAVTVSGNDEYSTAAALA
jgi:hypothetical protein